MIGFILRIIILVLMIWTGVMWFNTGAFIMWGLICLFLFVILMASFGLDGIDTIWYFD